MEIESKIVGRLKSVDYDEDFYESEPFPIPYFDNRKIKICFVESNHEPYLLGADNVIQAFLKLNNQDRLNDSHMVKNYYDQTLKFGYTKPLEIANDKDIWNFVHPSEILIQWDEKGDFYVVVSASCDWEEEHGLQLVFPSGQKLTRASGHDGHYED
jgi:hypothetical protein